MKRKASAQPPSTSDQGYVLISDSDTDTELEKGKAKAKKRNSFNARTSEVISISSDESENETAGEPKAQERTQRNSLKPPSVTKTEASDSLWNLPPLNRRGSDSPRKTSESSIRFKPEKGIEMLLAAANRVAQRQRQWLFGRSAKPPPETPPEAPTQEAEPHMDVQMDTGADADSDTDMDDNSPDEYDYEADSFLGGEMEIESHPKRKPPQDVDYVALMNRSYRQSCDRLLIHQEEMVRQNSKRAHLVSYARRPRISMPPQFLSEEMEIIFAMVAKANEALRPVDWDVVAKELSKATGYHRDSDSCLNAFEYAIQHHKKKSCWVEPDLLTPQTKTSIPGLLAIRERGRRQPHIIKDMLRLKKMRQYEQATSFNYSSGSVVDMAFKESSFKLAVANVATQDIYNRSGNLLLCDLNRGTTKQLRGHEKRGDALNQKMTVTVNDIKLSYSKDFFISGADDHKAMIWNAETGECVNSLANSRSRVNRLAIMEDSLYKEDVFATCSASGTTSNDDEQGDGILRVFDVQRAKEIEAVISGHEDVNLVDFSPCETYVISCSHRNEVAVFDRRFYAREPLHRFQHLHKDDDDSNAGITTALWWPTGLLGTSQSMLVTGGGDGAVRIWDIRRATDDAEKLSFDTHVGPVARMVASSNFEHLLVGADTGAVSAFTLDHGIVTQYANKPMTLLTDQDEML
ncbi:hypothetical protein BGX34_000288 [Mortierella sp. NVP85]|nr:hypothetical protein BGX34_000288 [Mortierella sp. NVP85]